MQETGVQELNRFLARSSEELDWFESFDSLMIPYGDVDGYAELNFMRIHREWCI